MTEVAVQQSWKQKAERGSALLAQIKELAREGKDGAVFDGAEDQTKARAMMEEAQTLFADAKKLREEADSKSAEQQLSELEREAAAMGIDPERIQVGGGSLDDLTSGRSGGHSKEGAEWNPFKQGKDQLVKASVAAMQHQLMETVMPQRVRETGRELARQAMRENASSVVKREIAALVEGTQANGGFLVVPQYLQDMFAAVRRQGNVLRRHGWLNIHQTEETNQVLFPVASGSLTVGLVAELAVKPTADNNYSQVTVSLYTMAGIASISRQLARSADPAIAEILAKDLAMLLGNLEEQLVYTGTGTQQPRGIVNTTGLSAAPVIAAGALQATQLAIIDGMLDTAATIATNYYGPPTGAILRPLRLSYLQKTKDNNNNYVLNAPGSYRAPGATQSAGDSDMGNFDIVGLPVAQSTNIPQNLGGGANQDCVIMGDWSEAHWFQRWDQQLDSSDIATDGAGNSAFATNRVLFRLEEIAGFTAARYPAAFAVLTGAGMVSLG